MVENSKCGIVELRKEVTTEMNHYLKDFDEPSCGWEVYAKELETRLITLVHDTCICPYPQVRFKNGRDFCATCMLPIEKKTMVNLRLVSTIELEKELQRRGKHTTTGTCPTCNKWSMTYKHYSGYGEHWHCDGCNQRIENCTCR